MEVKMKKGFVLIVALAIAFSLFVGTSSAFAQSARNASWEVSITYQNVGDASTNVTMFFYEEGSASYTEYGPIALEAGAGTSLWIGKVSLPSSFRGSAVLSSSSEPIVATAVQFSSDSGFKMRLLSNGFTPEQASEKVLIGTTLAQTFDRTTIFSIQNVEGEAVTATVEFFNTNGSSVGTVDYDIPAYSTKYIEMDMTGDTGLSSSTFNGSAVVTGKKSDNSDAMLVAGVSELYTDRPVAANFEGIPLSNAANTIYMATGLCENFGLDSFYAVQNADTVNATITVNYYDKNGNPVAEDGPYTIGPGQKKSIRTCDPNDNTNMSGFTGSAVVESTGGKIVAIGKAQGSLNAPEAGKQNVFAIFMGENAGASKQALPFVRWANDTNFYAASNTGGKQRAYIAVQNLESTQSKFNCFYYDKNGDLVSTHVLTIPGNSKENTNASLANALGKNGMVTGEFGYYTDGSFGGAVIIEAHPDNPTAKFIAISRVQHPGAGEDYNAVPVP